MRNRENTTFEKIELLEQEIQAIKERNQRVEADKAWEVSGFRLLIVTASTYVVATTVFYFIGVKNYFLNALIPTTAYIVSTQSMPALKRWWIHKNHQKFSKE